MIALLQGRLTGRNSAIECFEKGWDADEEHLNPMAYVALHRIHLFLGQMRRPIFGGRISIVKEAKRP